MEQDRYRLELKIEAFAEKHCYDDYRSQIEEYFEILGADVDKMSKEFDNRINKEGDNKKLREDLNAFILDYTTIDKALPNNCPIENYKNWVREEYAKQFTFKDYISDCWDFIEDQYYDYMKGIYNNALNAVENFIFKFVRKYDGLYCDEEQSRSWNIGKFPSIYFHIYKYDKDYNKEEKIIRFSDGHNNGIMSHDYEIIFDEYQEDDLQEILKEILWDLDIEQ